MATPDENQRAIDTKYGTDPKAAELISKLTNVKNKYATWRRNNKEPVWDLVDQVLAGIPPLDNFPYFSSYVDMELFKQNETMKPIFVDMMFPRDGPWFRYESEDPEDADRASAAEAIVRKLLRRNNLKPELLKWGSEFLTWGNSVLLWGWGEYESIARKVRALGLKNNAWDEESMELSKEGPVLEYIHHLSFYTDPFVEDPRYSPFCFADRIVTGSYLKTEVRENRYDARAVRDLIRNKKAGGVAGTTSKVDYDLQEMLDLIPDDGEYRETRCWSNNGWSYAYIDDAVLVRATENPFGLAPLLCLKNYPRPGEYYGKGEPEISIGNFRQLHDVTSLYFDAVHLGNMPMFKGRKSASADIRNIKFMPGEVALLDNLDDLTPMESMGKAAEISAVRMDIKRDLQNTSGVTDEVAGSGSEQRTATGIVRLQNAATSRIMYKVTTNLPVFEELYEILYNLAAQFLSDEIKVKFSGADGLMVADFVDPAEAFEPSISVEIEVGPGVTAREQRLMQFQQLAQMWSQDPRVDFRPIFLKGMRDFGFANPDRLWVNPVQVQHDVLKAIEQHRTSGIMYDAGPADNHMMWVQMLQMYMDGEDFRAMPMTAQQFVMARMQQHMAYLGLQQEQAGQLTQEGEPSVDGSQDQQEEASADAMFNTQLQGENANPEGT